MSLTIQDIADMAGVSRATVSKIINNYNGVNEKTKRKVMAIINETGYQPTFSAKSLATKKSNLIGVVYAGKINVDFTHPFFNKVISTFKRAVGKLGYDILMFSNEQLKQNDSYLARCKHFRVDGCLIIAGDEIEDSINELVQSDIPCVGIDIEINGPKSSYVTTDNKLLSEQVVEHFYQNSIREIAYIGTEEQESFVAANRKQGFYDAMNRLSLPIVKDWIQYGDFFDESGYKAMKRILSKKPYPRAVYATSDLMALGAIEAIVDHGLKVPEDICVVGCDDIEACRFSTPKLTTVRQDKETIGRLSAQILLDLINDKEEIEPLLVKPELVIRQSSGSVLEKAVDIT